jgi:CheY-like chemotaxis protein
VLLSALDFNASYEGTQAIAPDVCIAKPVRQQLLRSALEASRQPRKPFLAESEPVERVSTTERGDQPALGLSALVADDNAINREVAVAMLEELDCTVVLAEDGRAAVANAQQRRFDVILMDCQMPGMDGYAATEAIRRHESERGLPPTTIIALTANVMARDRERCLAAGMNAFLAKPFKGAQLLEVLGPIAGARANSSDAPEAAAGTTEPPAPPLALTDAEVAGLLEAPVADTAPISRLPVLDLEQVQSIRGLGKPLVFERLCEMLFSSSRDAFARLDTALAEGNLEEVAAAAHAFRSPVSNLGGRRLADLLERCETAALENADLAVVRRAATGLKPHYAALVAALEAETRRGTGTG